MKAAPGRGLWGADCPGSNSTGDADRGTGKAKGSRFLCIQGKEIGKSRSEAAYTFVGTWVYHFAHVNGFVI